MRSSYRQNQDRIVLIKITGLVIATGIFIGSTILINLAGNGWF